MGKKQYRTLAAMMALTLSASVGVVEMAAPATASAEAVLTMDNWQPPMGPPAEGEPPMGTPPDEKGAPQSTPPDGKNAPQGMPGGPGAQQKAKPVSELTAAKVIDAEPVTLNDVTFTADGQDQNAVLVRNGGALTLSKGTLTKTGDSSSADASNFTGQNAILLVADSQAHIDNLVMSSNADGANAVFATGAKAKITASHLRIHTRNDSSRGLDATYGGTIEATDVDITTEGAHCAAVATDRGEGTITVRNGSFQTSGQGSPNVYSTGNISVYDSQGQATGSEIAVVEGKNSITFENVHLSGMKDHGVMLYQSFSGDANVGEAHFTAKNSGLSNLSTGPMFYVTNTKAEAELENTDLRTRGDTLVRVAAGRWGKAGANGGDFELKAKNQVLTGAVVVDALSSFELELEDGSSYTGAFNTAHTAKKASIELAKKATLVLTADAYVTDFEDEQKDFKNVRSHGHNIYYDAKTATELGGRTYELPGGGKLLPEK